MYNIKHKLTKSEIKYGIITLSHDLTQDILKELPERFDIIINDTRITDRVIQIKKRRIWVGITIMKDFSPGDLITMISDEKQLVVKKASKLVYDN